MNDDYRGRGSQLGTLLTGIVIGVAAALWSNDSSRENIKRKLGELSDVGREKVQQGKKKLANSLDNAKKKLEEDEMEPV